METHIYYYDLDTETTSYLKGTELEEKLSTINLTPKIKTHKTPVLAANIARKDVNAQLLLVSKSVKDGWIADNKQTWLKLPILHVVENLSDAKKVLAETYFESEVKEATEASPEVPIETHETPEPTTDVTEDFELDTSDAQDNLSSKQAFDPFAEVQKAEEVKATTKPLSATSIVEDPFSSLINDQEPEPQPEPTPEPTPELQPEQVQESTPEPQVELNQTQTDISYTTLQSTPKAKHRKLKREQELLSTQEKSNGTIKVYQYKDTKSKAIESTTKLTKYDNTYVVLHQQFDTAKATVAKLTKQIDDVNAKYLGYVAPEEIETINKQYIELELKNEELKDTIAELEANKSLNTDREFQELQTKYIKVKDDLDNIKAELEDAQSEVATSTSTIEGLEDYKDKLEKDIVNYEEKLNSSNETTKNQLLRNNIQLSNKLREAQGKAEKLNITLKEKEAELQATNAPTISGVHENLEIWFSLSNASNLEFYNSVLSSGEYTKDKDLLVDLAVNSYISSVYNFKSYIKPYKWLTENEPVNNAFSKIDNINNSNLNVVTTVMHKRPRNILTKDIDWNSILDSVDNKRTVMYIGDISSNDIFEFIEAIVKADTKIKFMCVLSATKRGLGTDKFNLQGIDTNKINFVGSKSISYKPLVPDYFYSKVGTTNE